MISYIVSVVSGVFIKKTGNSVALDQTLGVFLISAKTFKTWVTSWKDSRDNSLFTDSKLFQNSSSGKTKSKW